MSLKHPKSWHSNERKEIGEGQDTFECNICISNDKSNTCFEISCIIQKIPFGDLILNMDDKIISFEAKISGLNSNKILFKNIFSVMPQSLNFNDFTSRLYNLRNSKHITRTWFKCQDVNEKIFFDITATFAPISRSVILTFENLQIRP